MQNFHQKTVPSTPIPTIETITMPRELAERLDNAAYFYGNAIKHIIHAFLPSITLANQCGNTLLISSQLTALEDYILQYTEQWQGIRASIDLSILREEGLLLSGQSEALAQSEIYKP